jgi:hypothetical protein
MTTTYVEQDCTFTSADGQHSATAGGAFIGDGYAIGYLSDDKKRITTWHGDDLGPARITATWRMPHSYISDRQYQVEAIINGVRYTGRTMGTGMIWRGKRKAAQS